MQHALGLAESVSQHPLEWLLLGVLLSLLLWRLLPLLHGRGRLSRIDYLVRLSFSLVILVLGYGLLASKLFLALGVSLDLEWPLFVCSMLLWLSYIAGLAIRRHHDIGQSGVWALLLLVPGLNVLHIGVYLTLRRGQTGRNRWGAVPHQPVNGVTKTEAPSLEPQPGSGVKNPLIDPQPEPGR